MKEKQTGSKDTADRLKDIRRELRDEYLQEHTRPWIVGFSGGKDSTLLLQLVIDMLLRVPPDERRREIWVISNDTLVESPIFQDFVNSTLQRLREGTDALQLPVKVHQTKPKVEQTFWVNLLGRGYPAPSRHFRWCTDRLKISPTNQFIRQCVKAGGEVVLLLGVRSAESPARARSIRNHAETSTCGRLSRHPTLEHCWVFKPIKALTDQEVWQVLLACRPPWGGSYRELVTLYKNAQGGECPLVVDESTAPSCGSKSARFGCWTCTVVEKDLSLDGLVDAGFENLAELGQFRQRLRDVSNDPKYRSLIRRNGQPGLGPLTLEARKLLLDELLQLQVKFGKSLISEQEVTEIKNCWADDLVNDFARDLSRFQPLTINGVAV